MARTDRYVTIYLLQHISTLHIVYMLFMDVTKKQLWNNITLLS